MDPKTQLIIVDIVCTLAIAGLLGYMFWRNRNDVP